MEILNIQCMFTEILCTPIRNNDFVKGEGVQKKVCVKLLIKHCFIKVFILFQALEAGRKESKEDWMEWLRRLSIELLKESPSPALRSCWALAQTYNSLAK